MDRRPPGYQPGALTNLSYGPGTLLSTFTASYTIAYVGGHPITKILPSHLAFYYAFVIAAATFVASIVTIVFGREVLGKRSAKETERRKFEAEFQAK